MKEVIEHFKNRAISYDRTDWVKNEKLLDSIVECIIKEKFDLAYILDLGAGTGRVSKHILERYQGEKEIFAVDICEEMLNKITEPQIRRYTASANNLPFANGVFDVVVSRQCLHYIENLDIVISELHRVLKSDGIFVLSQFVPFESKTKSFWIEMMKCRQPLRKHFYSEKEWVDLFARNGFYLKSTKTYTDRYSLKKWNELYYKNNTSEIKKYIDLLKNAPKQYLKEYNVIEDGNDLLITSICMTASFGVEK